MTPNPVRIGKVTWKPGMAPTRGRFRADASSDAAYDYAGEIGNSGLTSAFAYEADSLATQEFGSWNPYVRSPDAEGNWYRDRRVARTRDLVRNDGWATGGVTSLLDSTIGSHFRLRCRPNSRLLRRLDKRLDAAWAAEFANVVESEFRTWAEDPGHWADMTRRLSVVQMFRLMLAHRVIDGESITQVVWDENAIGPGGARFATRLQLIDPDRLSNPYEGVDTHELRGGVHIDDDGAPLGYHIRRAHQFDIFDSVESVIWDYIPRETPWGRPMLVHDYDMQRAAQHRGIGLLTPVLAKLKMLSRYDAAEMQQALLQTVIGTFIESPFDPEQLRMAMEAPADGDMTLNGYQAQRAAWHGARGTSFGGVRIPTLVPGEKIASITPRHPSNNFEMFEYAMLRSAASALGTTAEEFTRDFSKANYSSLRAAMLGAWKTGMRRRDDFASGSAGPIYAAFLEELIDREPGLLPAGAPEFLEARAAYAAHGWIGPGRGWVDPVKERQGAVLGLDAGFGTLDQECAEIGGSDWRDNLEQRAIEVAEFKRLGLKLPDWGGDMPANETETRPQPV